MADIPLRTYVQQLDNLIERKQVDEVIAHCRHILGLYPKHLDTYRMLGKALLEKGRHGDAADIFQRVLSVVPDDFISHVGMSIMREDEANLDAAIWHMERAFESAPANGAIQQELCRLYGRRDGVAPTKARLTRGALARMYAQGGLYLQAEAELKAALTAETDRIDLLTKLADVYWQTDQPAQAAQTSAAILQKLPYSLEANRILVNVFRAQGRTNDAVVYRQRLEALDPYEAFADPTANGAGAARVEAAKVAVARLEYVPGMEDSGSPDWLASIGAKFEEQASPRAPGAQPEWLSAAGENAPAASDYQPGQSSVPDWLKDLDSGPAGAADAQSSAPPDWLKDIAAPPAPQAAPNNSDEGLPDWLTTATGPLPADAVPDWMLHGAPQTSLDNDESGTAPLVDSTLQDAPVKVTDTAPAIATPAAALAPLEPAGEAPDWLKATAADEGEEDLPNWLKAITSEPLPEAQAQPSASPSTTIAAATIPDWLQGAAPGAGPVAADSPAAQDHVPTWLQTAANTPSGTGPLPDWLKVATGELDPAKVAHLLPPEPETIQPVAATAAIEPTGLAEPPAPSEIPAVAAMALPVGPTAEVPEPTSLGDLPDWLKGATDSAAGATAPVDAVAPAVAAEATLPPGAETQAVSKPDAAEALEPGLDMPDWLKNVAPTEAMLAASTPAQDAAASQAADAETIETAPSPLGDEELPDWLQAASAVPAQDQTPVWLQTAPAGPSLVESQAEQDPALDMPDWLRDLSASAPPPGTGQAPSLAEIGLTGGAEAPAMAVPAAPLSPELPDFLQIASPEAIARAEQPLEMEPEDMEPEEDEPAAALPAEIPDWLKALAPVSPDPSLPVPATPAPAVPEAPAEASLTDELSWMDELTAPAAPTLATPTAEPVPDEPPAWLAAPAALANSETAPAEPADFVAGGLAEDTLAAEIPPWAQNDEPGPSDTIASWLAGKHVPDWLRQPANDAPGLPAVEWEPNAAEAAAVDSLASASAPETAEPAHATATPEMAQAAAPDLESMDPEAAFRWPEGLAAQQGANPEELFTASAEPAPSNVLPSTAEPAPSMAEPPTPAAEVPSGTVTEPAMTTSSAVAPEPGGLEDFLKQTETAMPVEHLVDTAPSKTKRPAAEATAPDVETPTATATEPASLSAAPPAEAEAPTTAAAAPAEETTADFDADAAMRWLEGLAAQQGANPEELLTAPEDRTLEAPQWVAAEQAAATEAPEPAPLAPVADEATTVAQVPTETEPAAVLTPIEPTAERVETETLSITAEVAPLEAAEAPVEAASAEALSPDTEEEAAMRWLEGLAAQQGANPEELLTAPEERTLVTPAWISAAAQAAADEAQPAPETSPFEAVGPAASPITPAELDAEPEPAAPEPEPAVAPKTPEWLKALVPTEAEVTAAPVEVAAHVEAAAPAEPAEAVAPTRPVVTGDLNKLSRLAERLAATRRAREAEMEARFAEQRNQQEAARRWVEEKLDAKPAEPQPPAGLGPAARRVTAPLVAPTPPTVAPPPRVEVTPAAPTEASRPHPRPSIRVRRPQPAPEARPVAALVVPAVTPTAAAEALAHGQAALAGGDYATAVTHLSVVVEQGQHLDTVVQTLADVAAAGSAPVPVLRLLGDAYLRTDQLQKALDTYRQALRRL
jgi:tetratricopeptide (TPR) repeat protein